MVLNARQRKALDASDFGLPKERKYPMPDAVHVRMAIRYFKKCPPKDRATLAKNIIKKAREFNVKINPKNSPLAGYIPLDVISTEATDIITEASNIGMLSPIVGAVPLPPENNNVAQAIYDFAIGKVKVEEDNEKDDILPMVHWNIPEESWNVTDESINYSLEDNPFNTWVIEYKNSYAANQRMKYMTESMVSSKDTPKVYDIWSDVKVAEVPNAFPNLNTKSYKEDFLAGMVKMYLTKDKNLVRLIKNIKALNKTRIYKFSSIIPKPVRNNIVSEGFSNRLKIRIQDFIKGLKVTNDGKVKVNIKDRLSFNEYENIHKVIMLNRESGNINALKDNLVYVFSIIATIEKEYIDRAHRKEIDKNSKEYSDMLRLRALLISDFKVGLRYVLSKERNFNFMKYYEESTENNHIYEIDPKLFTKLGMLFKLILV